ncbi:hypothetical protein BGX34_002592 [Mortierella sp. NVP85]|nr:hypothetical protein BGX34_002592 [Mortierella sp. NVP85]
MDVIRTFKKDDLKDAKVVAEAVYLAPVLEKDAFRELFHGLYDRIDRSVLLDSNQLDGIAQLIRGAKAGYIDADDLAKILGLLSIRLNELFLQSATHVYQFTLAASHVLDAVADTEVRGLDREKLREALSPYLDSLEESSDPHLVYQAALDPAFQWGLCQRLGEIAANPSWDPDIRGNAIVFLGEIYRNDEEWGQQADIKRWILSILVQLSRLPENEVYGMWYSTSSDRHLLSLGIESSQLVTLTPNSRLHPSAKTLLEDLKTDGDAKKQNLYHASMDIDPSPYPLKVFQSIPTSSILLDRVQERAKRILTEESSVYSCAYSPNGELFAVGLRDDNISVYSTSNWEKIRTLTGYTNYVYGVAFSPMSNLIASGSADRTVKLWDVETGSMLRTLTGHTLDVYCIAYSSQRDQVASGSADSTVRIWDADTGDCLRTLSGHDYAIFSVAYSPDGSKIASASRDTTLRLWDVKTGECVRILRGHSDWVHDVAYSPQGNRIASCSDDKTVRVWDVDTGECLSKLVGFDAYSVAFSPKSNILACAGMDNTVKLWDIESGSRRTLTGHKNQVRTVVYSPNGNQIASGSRDKTVRLWDI